MSYKVIITPISTSLGILYGNFATEQEAREWTEQHNCPVVDYEVIQVDDDDGEKA